MSLETDTSERWPYRPTLRPCLQTSSPVCSVYDVTHIRRVFPKERRLAINKANRTLKEKIEAISTRCQSFESLPAGPAAKGSAAVELARRTKKIDRENKRLAKRLRNVESTVGK